MTGWLWNTYREALNINQAWPFVGFRCANSVTGTVEQYDYTDTDYDGLPRFIEDEIGSSDTNSDSDGDKVNDYIEFLRGTDPAAIDVFDISDPNTLVGDKIAILDTTLILYAEPYDFITQSDGDINITPEQVVQIVARDDFNGDGLEDLKLRVYKFDVDFYINEGGIPIGDIHENPSIVSSTDLDGYPAIQDELNQVVANSGSDFEAFNAIFSWIKMFGFDQMDVKGDWQGVDGARRDIFEVDNSLTGAEQIQAGEFGDCGGKTTLGLTVSNNSLIPSRAVHSIPIPMDENNLGKLHAANHFTIESFIGNVWIPWDIASLGEGYPYRDLFLLKLHVFTGFGDGTDFSQWNEFYSANKAHNDPNQMDPMYDYLDLKIWLP